MYGKPGAMISSYKKNAEKTGQYVRQRRGPNRFFIHCQTMCCDAALILPWSFPWRRLIKKIPKQQRYAVETVRGDPLYSTKIYQFSTVEKKFSPTIITLAVKRFQGYLSRFSRRRRFAVNGAVDDQQDLFIGWRRFYSDVRERTQDIQGLKFISSTINEFRVPREADEFTVLRQYGYPTNPSFSSKTSKTSKNFDEWWGQPEGLCR